MFFKDKGDYQLEPNELGVSDANNEENTEENPIDQYNDPFPSTSDQQHLPNSNDMPPAQNNAQIDERFQADQEEVNTKIETLFNQPPKAQNGNYVCYFKT